MMTQTDSLRKKREPKWLSGCPQLSSLWSSIFLENGSPKHNYEEKKWLSPTRESRFSKLLSKRVILALFFSQCFFQNMGKGPTGKRLNPIQKFKVAFLHTIIPDTDIPSSSHNYSGNKGMKGEILPFRVSSYSWSLHGKLVI